MRKLVPLLIILFLFPAQPGESRQSPRKPTLPLKSEDLASDEVAHLSAAGAHSYIVTKVDYLGLPALHYRQFSDWNPGGPLFNPILGMSVLGKDGQPAKAEVNSYEWRPDRASLGCKYGELVEGKQSVGYVDKETIVGVIHLRSLAGEPVTVRLSGTLSDRLDTASVTPLPALQGFRLEFAKQIPNEWGYPPTPLKKEYIIAASPKGLKYGADGRAYSVTYSIPAGGEEQIRIVLSPASRSEQEIWKLLNDPQSALHATTRLVNKWLGEVKKPRLKDEHQLRMYYNAWYQFWYNTEHAEGMWSRPIITPSKSRYGRGVWLWDTGFHVFALIQGGKDALRLAKDQVIVLSEGTKVVGHLPREVWVGATNSQLQAPGILTWAAMEIYKRDKDKAFLKHIYDGLAKNNDWFYANRDSNHNGLCEWKRSDSGWDTSPRWDKGEVDAVDLNCWLYLDQVKLAEMCRVLGRGDEAREWIGKSERTRDLIREKLWDEAEGCYYDLHPATGEMVKIKTPATFWTMFAGAATPEQAERMVKILTNPEIFWTKYPMPCVGANEPAHNPNDYWRGPVWINLNWITILGLEKYGYRDLARELRSKSLELIGTNAVPCEYYNPHTGAGLGARNYMWTGALYVVMCNEQ